MRLKPHQTCIRTVPGQEPRKVTFLAYKGRGRCKIVDTENQGTSYPIVPRDQLSEVAK